MSSYGFIIHWLGGLGRGRDLKSPNGGLQARVKMAIDFSFVSRYTAQPRTL